MLRQGKRLLSFNFSLVLTCSSDLVIQAPLRGIGGYILANDHTNALMPIARRPSHVARLSLVTKITILAPWKKLRQQLLQLFQPGVEIWEVERVRMETNTLPVDHLSQLPRLDNDSRPHLPILSLHP